MVCVRGKTNCFLLTRDARNALPRRRLQCSGRKRPFSEVSRADEVPFGKGRLMQRDPREQEPRELEAQVLESLETVREAEIHPRNSRTSQTTSRHCSDQMCLVCLVDLPGERTMG